MIAAIVIIGLLLLGGLCVWLLADDTSQKQQTRAKLNTFIHQIPTGKPIPGNTPNELFAVEGRQQFTQTTMQGQRQQSGPDLGPLPTGNGRVKNPNAVCWACGQKKTANHECP